jgi:calcium-dependent protein kinase
MLLSSQMPFYGRKRSAIIEQILEGKYEFRGRRWKKVSAQAKDFVESLLVVDPADRATAEEAFSMSWLNKRYAATVRAATDDEIDMAKASLFRYSKYSKLKRMALMVVAHKSTSAEIGILRKIFQQYDTERDGSLTYEEFKAAYAQAGMSEEAFSEMFDAVDLDGTGRIRYTEFLAATIEARGAISEERLAEAFDRIDSDDSGYISAANLRQILGEDFPEEEIEAIIREADLSKDGQISYSEFLALWEDKNETLQELTESGSRDSGSNATGATADIVARANFIESKQTARRRSSSIIEVIG